MKTLVLVLSVLVMLPTFGQSLLPVAFTTAADNYQNGSVLLEISCGESITETMQSSSAFLTTGFLQGTLNTSNRLVFKVFPEGLYAGNNNLQKALSQSGYQFPGPISDVIGLKIHSGTNYARILYAQDSISLDTMGIASLLVPGFIVEPSYLCLHHRNCIPTVSSIPMSFNRSPLFYDFTTSSSKAFGNKLKEMDGVFVLYSGDVNEDGLIDLLDMLQITTHSNLFSMGYMVEDLNGDGGIDALDMILCDNNAALKIQAVTP